MANTKNKNSKAYQNKLEYIKDRNKELKRVYVTFNPLKEEGLVNFLEVQNKSHSRYFKELMIKEMEATTLTLKQAYKLVTNKIDTLDILASAKESDEGYYFKFLRLSKSPNEEVNYFISKRTFEISNKKCKRNTKVINLEIMDIVKLIAFPD